MRYRVLDLPAVGVGAFTPLPAVNPVASSFGLVHVYGAPGNEPVTVPAPERSWAPQRSQLSPELQPSNVSPDLIAPSVYLASTVNMGPSNFFGMEMRRRTPLPIPARTWKAVVRQAIRGAKIGGRGVVDNPRAFQRFPNVGVPTAAGLKSR